ncbi:MAG TPA: glycosyltransferase, partial [Acidimicrobiales bacterium]|nr:glycosyltransferase [Acidimicrobiales bacterium]
TLAGALRLVSYRIGLVDDTRRHLARIPGRGPAPGDLRLTVVVPAYQEAGRIGASVRRIREALAPMERNDGAEVLVVDDGSADATAAEARAAGARVVSFAANRGKGAAVRDGVMAARGRTIAFVDADLAYPPEQLLCLLGEVEAGWDVVVGSRRHPASVEVVRPSLVRSLSGRLFNLLTAVVLLGRYRDTQCGCKAFRSDVARLIFARTRVNGFAFDVEVFHLVERYRLSLTEIPVVLEAAAGSTVRVGVDAVRMVGDLFRVRRWSAEGAYDLDAATAGHRRRAQ